MSRPRPIADPREAARLQRREVIGRSLAWHGLGDGGHPAARAVERPDAASWGRRLRRVLDGLGPVFGAFGVYCAGRPDLLPLADAAELAAAGDGLEPLPAAELAAALAAGLPPGVPAPRLAETAFDARFPIERRRGRLADGSEVIVELAHPRREDGDDDLALLPELAPAFLAAGLAPADFASAVEDFRRGVLRRGDLAACAPGDAAVAPRPELSSARLLVHPAAGMPLSELLASGGQPPFAAAALARSLAVAWLRLALFARPYPVAPRPQDVVVLPDGEIAFLGGPRAVLDGAPRDEVAGLLAAVAEDVPQQVVRRLSALAEVPPDAAGEEVLLQAVRQAVPFRDGGWSRESDGGSLAEGLFLALHLTARQGVRPAPPLRDFARGLFWIAAAAHRLAPAGDPVAAAWGETRVGLELERLRGAAGFDRLGADVGRQVAALAALPGRLDQALSLAADGAIRVRLEIDPPRPGAAGGGDRLLGPLLALAGLALASPRLADLPQLAGWGEGLGAALFVVVGALLLWRVGRRR